MGGCVSGGAVAAVVFVVAGVVVHVAHCVVEERLGILCVLVVPYFLGVAEEVRVYGFRFRELTFSLFVSVLGVDQGFSD